MSKLPTLAPQNMSEAIEFSKMVAGSGMVPPNYKNKPQDVLVAIQWGYELNLQPLQALQNISVINGKPAVYGDAALALVKNDPRCAGVTEWIEGEGDDRSAYCKVKRRYGDQIEETVKSFSVADAKRARLWGKQGPWSQYPDRMLTMRARGFALRDSFPDSLKGMITSEEAQDYPTEEPKNVTPPANPLDAIEAPQEPVEEPEVVEVPETIEAAPEATESEPEVVMFDMKTHKGNVMDSFPGSDRFASEFLQLIKRYAAANKTNDGQPITPRDKMTMLRELKEANSDNLDRLMEKQLQPISEAYMASLKRLGAESNDGKV